MDSDLDRSTTVGTGRTTANATGTRTGVAGTAPVHNSRVANTLDPRVPGSGPSLNEGVGAGRSGPASGTHGPHRSNLMNKARCPSPCDTKDTM